MGGLRGLGFWGFGAWGFTRRLETQVLPHEGEVGGGATEGDKEPESCVIDYTMCWEAKPGGP